MGENIGIKNKNSTVSQKVYRRLEVAAQQEYIDEQ